MLRPDDLYEIVDESVATGPAATPKVLVHSLDGFMDAGQAGRVTADHLLEVLDSRLLARFDVDLLHDYRARRPEVTCGCICSPTTRASSSCCSRAPSPTATGIGSPVRSGS
jgi:hypothetical protein